MWTGKHVLLGISGGIAAYKTPELVRLFIKAGAEVKVVSTPAALAFVSRLSLETVSKNPVCDDLFAPYNPSKTEHIALVDWADLFVIAPATANVLGKMANGIADDALTTIYLACAKPVFAAPAMNTKMYEHKAVQRNMETLKQDGVVFIEPVSGELACGDIGKGKMEDPVAIFDFLNKQLTDQQPWGGKTVLITAGPTHERLDPVRFIGNHSSGKMGFALAEACAARGARVLLVSGPVDLKTTNERIERIDVVSAADMYEACLERFAEADMAIFCAAVADFTPAEPAAGKTKRTGDDWQVRLIPTRDIAAELGRRKADHQVLVGFALETDREEANALEKMERKNLDFIVLNSLRQPGAGFGHDTNQVTIYSRDGYRFEVPLNDKSTVAKEILSFVNDKLYI